MGNQDMQYQGESSLDISSEITENTDLPMDKVPGVPARRPGVSMAQVGSWPMHLGRSILLCWRWFPALLSDQRQRVRCRPVDSVLAWRMSHLSWPDTGNQ